MEECAPLPAEHTEAPVSAALSRLVGGAVTIVSLAGTRREAA